jgi:hypothetical protein
MKRPSFQFYPGDWLHDIGVRACSLAARGLWMDMLSFMHQANPYGHLLLPTGGEDGCKDTLKPILIPILARMVGSAPEEVERLLAELEQAEVFSRTAEGVIFSRRMVQDEKVREARASGGAGSLKNPNVPRPKATRKDTLHGSLGGSLGVSLGGSPSSSSSSSKTSSSEPQIGSDVVTPPVGKNKKKSSPSKPPSREACKLASLLITEIHNNKADYRITPAQERNWEATADVMLRRDGRSYEEIAELIRWAQRDDFWRTNILSMGTLCKQFDKLALKREAATNSRRKTPKATAIIGSAVENHLALLEGGVQ